MNHDDAAIERLREIDGFLDIIRAHPAEFGVVCGTVVIAEGRMNRMDAHAVSLEPLLHLADIRLCSGVEMHRIRPDLDIVNPMGVQRGQRLLKGHMFQRPGRCSIFTLVVYKTHCFCLRVIK